MVEFETEIYASLGFNIEFYSPFSKSLELIKNLKIIAGKTENVRKLANSIIYDIVSRSLIICYSSENIAVCSVYFALIILDIIKENTLLSDFILENKIKMIIDFDMLTTCGEDLTDFYYDSQSK